MAFLGNPYRGSCIGTAFWEKNWFESHSENIFKRDKTESRSFMLLVAIYSMEYWQITESHTGVFNITLADISMCYCLLLCKSETVYREILDLEMC